jgi:hypothetical protein
MRAYRATATNQFSVTDIDDAREYRRAQSSKV